MKGLLYLKKVNFSCRYAFSCYICTQIAKSNGYLKEYDEHISEIHISFSSAYAIV